MPNFRFSPPCLALAAGLAMAVTAAAGQDHAEALDAYGTGAFETAHEIWRPLA